MGQSNKDEEREGLVGGRLIVSHFAHYLDPKKRLTIPASWRELVGEPSALYIMPGLKNEKCLYVYPAREMPRLLERIRGIGSGDQRAKAFARFLGNKSDYVSWDPQGRIRIRDDLLEFAGLAERVEMHGAWNHIELWNEKEFNLWKSEQGVEQTSMADMQRYFEDEM